MKALLTLLALLMCGMGPVMAQNGRWNPPGADLSYPRTLLKAGALAQVQASLAAPDRLAVYQSVWADVQGPPPTDNSSSSGRRARATFAKNAAFVVLLNRQPAAGGLTPLAAAPHDTLAARARVLLESLNPDVEVFATWAGTTPYTEWQWRSKELIDYLVAYDLLRGAGLTPIELLPAQARLQVFAGNLYRQATTPLSWIYFFDVIKNNHALMTAAALGLAAVVLNDATSPDPAQQPVSWANAGLFHIDNVLWRDAQRQSDSTQVAGYAEGPYYFKYAMLNCLPFFRAMGHFLPDGWLPYRYGPATRRLRNPYFDPKYSLLYSWVLAIMQPDGRLPALEDSYVDLGMPELALTGNPQFVKPMYFSKLTGTGMASALAQLRDLTVDMRAAWLAANVAATPPGPPPLTALPASGNLVFRSGPDSLATYFHLYGRSGLAQANAGGHSQGDAGSFILHAQGQLLALDPGYLSYTRRAEVGQATHHNLVLVDGAGPDIGQPLAPSPVQARIQHPFCTPQLSYGEVTTSYLGAAITRKTVFVRGTYVLLADEIQAASPHAYTWQLHGYGLQGGTAATGVFTDGLAAHEGSWQKNGVTLLAHVATAGGSASYTTATNVHETTYNTAESHTTLLVQQTGATQALFLAALCPYTTQRPGIVSTSQAATAALATTGQGYIDVAFAQADTVLRADASGQLPQAMSADGRLNLYSATTAGGFAQLFVQAGTTLRLGPVALLRTTRRATVSWQRTSLTRYDGYASTPTTLTLALDRAPNTVNGVGVASFAYDASRQQLQVVLQTAANFVVTVTVPEAAGPGTPLPVSLTNFSAKRQAQAGHLSWHTASEVQCAGFEVQRQTEGVGTFATLGFVPGQGHSVQPRAYEYLDEAAPTGRAYYRLRQLDIDGKATYSPVVALVALPDLSPCLLLAVPQPATDVLYVQLAGPDQMATLQLLDALGRVVRQQPLRHQAEVDVRALPPGCYFLRAHSAAGQLLAGSQKIIVVP